MKFTIEQYTALKEAIVKAVITGVKTVSYGDKTVTYLSIDEMRKALKMMEEELFPERFGRKRRFAEIDRGYFENTNRRDRFEP